MRTTLTLDDDVAVALQRVQKETGKSFREVVNALLRAGIDFGSGASTPRARAPFSTPERDLGPCRYASLDNVQEVLSVAEGDRIE